MATITLFQSADVLALGAHYGGIVSFSDTQYGISDGSNSAIFFGDFGFTPDGTLTGGTIAAIDVFSSGAQIAAVQDASVDAILLDEALRLGDAALAAELLLQSADILIASDGNTTLRGYAGDDELNGGAGNDLLEGGDNDDVLSGGAGADQLYGGAGSDVLLGGAGSDILYGGEAVDFVSYAGSSTGVTAWLGAGYAIDDGGAQDILFQIEAVIGSDHADVIGGVLGVANILQGGGGDDYIDFEPLDTISGGAGTDRAVAFAAFGTTGVNINLGAAGIEWLWGSDGDDVVNGTSAIVTLTVFGFRGNDVISGGAAGDQLYGMEGADTLIGGDGEDWLYVDGADVVGGSIQGNAGSDRVASLDGSALSLDLGASTVEWVWASNHADNLDGTSQTQALVLFGFDGADTLRGGSAADNLYGQAGADGMYGGDGDDVLYFDSDDTIVDGGAGFDTAQVLDYTGLGVALDLTARQIEVVHGSNQSDNLDATNAAWAVYMNGYGGDDVLTGGDGADNIYGGSGADTIAGGEGNDFLDAGGGAEIDILQVSGNQADYLLHYVSGALSSVQDLVGGRDGWDNVVGFERIQFADNLQVL